MSKTDVKKAKQTGDREILKWKITQLNRWISRCISREDRLRHQGHREVIDKVDELLSSDTPDIKNDIHKHYQIGYDHFRHTGGVKIQIRKVMPETPYGRALFVGYMTGLAMAATEELSSLESALTKMTSPETDGKTGRETQRHQPKKAAHKTSTYPTPTDDDEDPGN